MKNTGTATWTTGPQPASGQPSGYMLVAMNPTGTNQWNTIPGIQNPNNAVPISATGASSVVPGQTATFTFVVNAPSGGPGSFNFQWQMMHNFVVIFGTPSTNVVCSVLADNTAFVSQVPPPSTMTAGQSYPVSVTMQNTGASTWADGTCQILSENPRGNQLLGVSSHAVVGAVAPGGSTTVSFNAVAPTTPGSYNFQWSLSRKNIHEFGQFSTNVPVTVVAATTAAAPTLTAAATGANKITLYWNGISGASGYNVYRSTVSGGPYTRIASGASTADPGPGMTNAFMYSDTAGLATGTEYFYVVTAVQSGTEGPQSNEASDIPQAGAVPWDTGDPVQILNAETAQIAAVLPPDLDPDTGEFVSADVGLLTAQGPNGVIYEGADADGNPAASYASPGYYDAVNQQIVYSDGTTQPVQPDQSSLAGSSATPSSVQPAAQQQALQQNLSFQFPPSSGIQREVLSQPGYVGLSTTELIFPSPSTSSGSVQLSPSGKPGQVDSADIYTGGRIDNGSGSGVSGTALDAGLTLMTSNAATDPAWAPTIQGQRNKSGVVTIDRPHSLGDGLVGNQRILLYGYATGPLQMSFVTGGQDRRYLQGRVALHFRTNYKLIVRGAGRKILNPDAPLRYGSITMSSAQPSWIYRNGPSMEIKRINSIAQNIKPGIQQLYNNSFLYDCAWGGNQSNDQEGMLFQYGSGFVPWDQSPQVTYEAGGYPNPNTSVVFFRANAPYHSEDSINLSTTPDSTLPGR